MVRYCKMREYDKEFARGLDNEIPKENLFELLDDYIEAKQQIKIGLYNASTFEPLAAKDSDGIPMGETLNLR